MRSSSRTPFGAWRVLSHQLLSHPVSTIGAAEARAVAAAAAGRLQIWSLLTTWRWPSLRRAADASQSAPGRSRRSASRTRSGRWLGWRSGAETRRTSHGDACKPFAAARVRAPRTSRHKAWRTHCGRQQRYAVEAVAMTGRLGNSAWLSSQRHALDLPSSKHRNSRCSLGQLPNSAAGALSAELFPQPQNPTPLPQLLAPLWQGKMQVEVSRRRTVSWRSLLPRHGPGCQSLPLKASPTSLGHWRLPTSFADPPAGMGQQWWHPLPPPLSWRQPQLLGGPWPTTLPKLWQTSSGRSAACPPHLLESLVMAIALPVATSLPGLLQQLLKRPPCVWPSSDGRTLLGS
mmetsp:Transcript_114558/g.286301  ORF Transcript_114558/g.286301 Transcript_114558/m.286301 type:complete len:345 (+) Transcript_114558:226-1260(+)